MKYTYKDTFILFLFVCFTLALLSSCQSKTTPSYIGDSASVIRLEGVELKNPDLYMGYILASDDSLLYIKSLLKDTLMHLYEVKGDSLILKQKFITSGNGPFEVNPNGFIFSYDKPTKRITVLDNPGTLTKGYMIDTSSENNLCDTDTWQTIDFSEIKNYMFWGGFLQLNDSVLLTLGGRYDTQEILSLIDLNSLSVTPLDFWPDDGFQKNMMVKQGVYMHDSKLFKNDLLDRYLYVCGHGKYMETFTISDNTLTDRSAICTIYPEYEMREDKMNYKIKDDSMDRGFSVAVTHDFIYAKPVEHDIFMLRQAATYKGYPCHFNDKIDVYDWHGNFIKRYELDIPVLFFVVDEKNETLYASSYELESGGMIVRKYAL